jgi:hypothetical protein
MTLLDGLDLFATLEDMTVSMRNTKVYRKEYVDNLRRALEAALALCRAYHTYIHYVPDHDAEDALSHVAHFETDLDTALKPFRKEGLG